MATPATVNPFNFYPGRDGLPLQNGYLYFGEPFQDPELQPLQAYWDDANTQPAARPIRTINGYPARNGAPAQVFVAAQYSMRVRDSQGREVFYAPNVTAVDLGGGGLDIITASGGQTVVNLTNAAYTPGSNAIDVSLNGLILISGQDYFETGTTRITMASALSAGDQIRAFARSTFGLTQAVLSDWQAEVFDGDGTASQNFTLTRNPGAVANLDISVAGSTLRPLLDYTLSGQVVTITPAPAAGTDNVLIRYGRSLPQDALRGELASTASAADGAGLVGIQPDSGGTTGVQATTVLVNLNARTRSVLDFIPSAKHAGIRAHTNTDDLTTYFQNAAIAVNRDVVGGAGKGGKVLVPAGRYRTNKVGCRDTIFQGDGFNYSIVQAYSAGTGVLFDCALDRDGTTANTDGGFGGFAGLKLDGRSLGYSGVRTYGGFSTLEDLYVTGFVDGVDIGLPISMLVKKVYSVSNTGKGFHTYSGAGDIATSLTCIGCWGDSNGTYNFHIEQLSYSSFISCASQNIPATGRGWFAEGSTNGTGVGSSLIFTACASEGDLGEPFYFKNQRGLVITSPKFVSQPSTEHLITLDNATGTLNGAQLPAAGGGFYGVSVANFGDSNGAIVAVGGSFSINPADIAYFSNIGAEINGVRSANVAGVLRSQNSQSGNYTLVAADAYKEMLYPAGAGAGTTFTIPANSSVAYPIGTELLFVNRSGNNLSIAITTDTMILAGTFTTGTRTLATQGIATAKKIESATWIISGVALT